MTKLSGREIAERAPQGWVYLLGALHTRLRTGDFTTGLALVDAVGAAAEAMDHHPDLDLRYTHVDVRLISHDVGAVTGRDLRLATAVSELAAGAGVTLDPAGPARLELALDTPDHAAVRPFWHAVLGGAVVGGAVVGGAVVGGAVVPVATDPDPAAEVQDPAGVLPTVWFQQSGGEEPRQHWHPDLWIDPSQVRPRIDAALAAGGTLVSDAAAPSFWVLADPEGNKVCLCTWQDRS